MGPTMSVTRFSPARPRRPSCSRRPKKPSTPFELADKFLKDGKTGVDEKISMDCVLIDASERQEPRNFRPEELKLALSGAPVRIALGPDFGTCPPTAIYVACAAGLS